MVQDQMGTYRTRLIDWRLCMKIRKTRSIKRIMKLKLFKLLVHPALLHRFEDWKIAKRESWTKTPFYVHGRDVNKMVAKMLK